MGVSCTAVGSAIESYEITPGMALWPIGKIGDGWLLLPTGLEAIMDPDVCPDVCPLAGTLLDAALLVGKLRVGLALAIVPPVVEFVAVETFAVALVAVGA
jgi:hypothetical protein